MPQKVARLVNYAALVLAIVLLQLAYCGCKHELASQHLSSEQQQLAVNLKEITKAYLVDQLHVMEG